MIWAMAMNSPPRRRYRTASEAITPTREIALEIGCFCTTTLMAQSTATSAKMPKKRRSTILREQSHQKAGEQQIYQRDREKELPREAHQLVITKTRESRANPDENKKQKTDFRQEPENRSKCGWNGPEDRHAGRDEEQSGTAQENGADHRQGNAIERPDIVDAVINAQRRGKQKDRGRSEIGTPFHRPQRMPSAEEEQRRYRADGHHIGVFRGRERREAQAAVFHVEARHQFVLRFRKIERDTVRFRERRDHENDETENLRRGEGEDRPVRNPMPGTVLRLHDVTEAERPVAQQRRGNREAHRQFITDHLRRAAQAAKKAVLAVRCPSAQRNAIDAQRTDGENHEDAYVDVRQFHHGLVAHDGQ